MKQRLCEQCGKPVGSEYQYVYPARRPMPGNHYHGQGAPKLPLDKH